MTKKILYITLSFIIGLLFYQVSSVSEVTNATKKAIALAFSDDLKEYDFYGKMLYAKVPLEDTTIYTDIAPLFEVETETYRLHGYLFYEVYDNEPSGRLSLLAYFSYISRSDFILDSKDDDSNVTAYFTENTSGYVIDFELGYHASNLPAYAFLDLTEQLNLGMKQLTSLMFYDSNNNLIAELFVSVDLTMYTDSYVTEYFTENISVDVVNERISKQYSSAPSIIILAIYASVSIAVYFLLFRKKKTAPAK